MRLVVATLAVLASIGAFFFATTRGSLIVRSFLPGAGDPAAHVYPIYSNKHLIRLVDIQPVIAAILLFQYDRIVSLVTGALARMKLRGKPVLITSCAFGDVIPRVVGAARSAGAGEVRVVDLIENELRHAQRKVGSTAQVPVRFDRQDAAQLDLPDGSVGANVLFFLLHELPDPAKRRVLSEACRVLAPGGKLFLAEFHRPDLRALRLLSWTYFKVFEPLGLALWNSQDPLLQLSAMPGMRCERRTVFFGNFQVIVATKNRPPLVRGASGCSARPGLRASSSRHRRRTSRRRSAPIFSPRSRPAGR
jgi:ubiquinone/menaquinone biosynthesis C-methylase UbiE